MRVSHRRIARMLLAGACVCSAPSAAAYESLPDLSADADDEPPLTGVTLRLDNDYFSMTGRDYDYTGGDALTFYGRAVARWPVSLDASLDWVDAALPVRNVGRYRTLHALQIGQMAFTPRDLRSPHPIRDDRPYASLVYLSNNRTYVDGDDRPVFETSITFGLLGLPLAEHIQHALHKHFHAGEVPRGWRYQISDGGEPTVRVTVGRQSLLDARSDYDVKWGSQASVGFITELNVFIAARWGDIHTPWWSATTERFDFHWQPVASDRPAEGARELYLYGGGKVWARAYNVFLQGQFRDSEVTFDSDELHPLIAEVWLGAAWQFSSRYRVNYVLRSQTSEIRRGRGSRSQLFAGVYISWSL